MSIDALYPPAPANVPTHITRPDSAYRLRVLAMVGGLFLFLVLYLVFIVLAGLLAYWLLTFPLPEMRGRGIIIVLILKFGGAFAALLLWLFLFKGLFKGQRVERSTYVTLQEKDHPELFGFIRKVYQDTGAPPPRRVHVSPDVNAALVYDTSLLSLVVPPSKDLLLGLGLVNVVNLVEFKAVLAHEFGHFAQRSGGLGSYLYVANRVMGDVIYSRDALDRFVDEWAQQDIRFSFPAWGLKGVLWGVRQVLGGTYKGLNLLHLSLSRQMEFNADNVAVSVTGSDALIHGLSRLGFASDCLADAAHALNAAADHGLFSDDLFYHQTQAATRLRRVRKEPRAGVPPELPADPVQQVQVFTAVDDGIPDEYRSHPTDHMREQNAKRLYIRSPEDERSPWLLFGNVAALKAEVTERFYRHMLRRVETCEPRPAPYVQEFIDAEHAESTIDPRYHGVYDDRFLQPGDVNNLFAQPLAEANVAAWLESWPPARLEQQVQDYRKRRDEYNFLIGVQTGQVTPKGTTFRFRDRDCRSSDAERLCGEVNKELEADEQAFQRLDSESFLNHWSLARHLDSRAGQGREADLVQRYRFHAALQETLRRVLGEQGRLQSILGFLSTQPQLNQADFSELQRSLTEVRQTLTTILEESKTISTPALANVPAGSALHDLIVDRGNRPLPALGNSISGEWLGKLLDRLDGVLSRLRRVHYKSLGRLLVCQENLVKEWQSAGAAAPSGASVGAT
jgi:Zn-dependent protease with chaperone function